jgi:immune inhibitor A
VDDISIPEIGWSDDFESGVSSWTANGFVLTHNYIPQVWHVRAVEEHADGSILVHDVEINDGNGELSVNFDEMRRLVVFVIGQTRHTDVPASYRVEVK